MSDRFESKLYENLSSEMREFLQANKALIPVIIALGPYLANKVRLEHLEYLVEHKDMIPMVIKTGGICAWIMLEGFGKMQSPYVGFILE